MAKKEEMSDDFREQITQLSQRIQRMNDSIGTEEATKNAMVMPFFSTLGYDVFNPAEVIPEYTCDVGIKKNEKIDYAICRDGQPVMLVECKHWSKNLDSHNGQLFRYFAVSKARFGLLTNGLEYRFFSDTMKPNIMDDEPFFIFRLDDPSKAGIEGVRRFHKDYFDHEVLTLWSNQLKNTNRIKEVLINEFNEPSEPYVRCILKLVQPVGSITSKMVEDYTPLIKRSIVQIITDKIVERVTVASEPDVVLSEQSDTQQEESHTEASNRVLTTQEELEGFYLIRSMLRPYVSPSRLHHRDSISYFSVLLDDNNRKPICRLWLNRGKKYIGVFDKNKNETKHVIKNIDDIYHFEKQLAQAVSFYDQVKNEEPKNNEE